MMDSDFTCKLAAPHEVKEMLQSDEETRSIVKNKIKEIQAILSGASKKILLIIGPCSADHEDSVIDYISRLCPVQEKVSDKILIVPRIYTNKPRTTGVGYKGFLHQPDPANKPDLYKGIVSTRHLHLRAIKETGFGCADEMLYPENHKYLDDLLVYVAVGARSVENQQHRLTASGVGIPVGMKNPTSGDYSVMMNSIVAAHSQHSFIYRGWEAHSHGNPYAHAILRGYTSKQGYNHPNYHYEDLEFLADMYEKYDFPNPACIIDANHCNSNKNPIMQPRIIKEVLQSRSYNKKINNLVKGFMVESYIETGAQSIDGDIYGKSITDPCLGWKETERMIYDLAEAL